MTWMIVFTTLFIVMGGLTCFTTPVGPRTLRNCFKALTLPCLFGLYLTNYKVFSIWLLLGLIFAWIGDCFLLSKRFKLFITGGVSFLLGQVFYMVAFISSIHWENLYTIQIVCPILVGLVMYVFAQKFCLCGFMKMKMRVLSGIYLFTNMTLTIWSSMRFLSNPTFLTAFGIIGALSFFWSDVMIVISKFKEGMEYLNTYYVLPSYFVAMFLFTLSFC